MSTSEESEDDDQAEINVAGAETVLAALEAPRKRKQHLLSLCKRGELDLAFDRVGATVLDALADLATTHNRGELARELSNLTKDDAEDLVALIEATTSRWLGDFCRNRNL